MVLESECERCIRTDSTVGNPDSSSFLISDLHRSEKEAGEASTYIPHRERQREPAATTASGYGVLAVTVSLSVMISRANFRLNEAQSITIRPITHPPSEIYFEDFPGDPRLLILST